MMKINSSKKRIAFYFDRSSLAKFYAPVVIEFLNRNFNVFFLCGPKPSSSWSNNPGYRPLKENIKIPFVDRVEFIYFDKFKEAEKLLVKSGITDLFVSHAINDDLESFIYKIKNKRIKTYCIQWAADYLTITPDKMESIENIFVNSFEMIEIYFRHFPEASRKDLCHKFIPTGNPIFDCLKENRTKDFLLQKYKIPKRKKIILLMSVNLIGWPWAKYYFGASNKLRLFLNFLIKPNLGYFRDCLKFGGYKNSLQIIKNWCQNNEALLVIKSRPKHKEPAYVKEIADVLISDETFYPLASVELASISDLIIGYESTVTLEAGFLGVKSISIDVDAKSKIPWRRTLNKFAESGVYEWEGVSEKIDYRKLEEYLKKHNLNDFKMDPKSRQEYIKKFLGYDDFNSSKRITDYLLNNK